MIRSEIYEPDGAQPLETCSTCRCRQGAHSDGYQIIPVWERWYETRSDDFMCHSSLVKTPEGVKRSRPCVGWLRYTAARDRGYRPTLQQISDIAGTTKSFQAMEL